MAVIPFRYRAGKTVLHRVPAGIKLLAVMVLSTAACASVYGLAAAIVVILAASIAARIPPWELLKGARMLAVISLCVMLLNYQTPVAGIITALRIFVPFAAAALLFAVTTMRELRLSLGALEIRLKKLFSGGRVQPRNAAFFSLGISLMLGFIPRLFELWETANLACDARVCKRGPRRLLLLVPLVTERMMEAAADTALALEARGLGVTENPTPLRGVHE
jgi:biotin transport system permease protein